MLASIPVSMLNQTPPIWESQIEST